MLHIIRSRCGCLPDCFGTQFSIFQSRESFENVGQICQFKNRKYPSSLLCALCTQLTRNFKVTMSDWGCLFDPYHLIYLYDTERGTY